MPFNVSEFLSTGARLGFTRPAYFMAAFPAPPPFLDGDVRFLSYLCTAANLPGVQIITQDGKYSGYGPTQKFPVDVLHSDITLTFYSDGAGEVLAFFDRWMRNVVAYGKPRTSIGGGNIGDVQYPSHYQTRLELFQYNDAPGIDEIEVLNYTMDHCYPIAVSDVGCDWSNGNAIQMVQVTFAFKNFWLQQNVAAEPGENFSMLINSDYYGMIMGAVGNAEARLEGALGISPGIIGLAASNILGELGVAGDIGKALTKINKFGQMVNTGVRIATIPQSIF